MKQLWQQRLEAERAGIVEALRETRGNMLQAAAALGIGYATIYRKTKAYEITRQDWEEKAKEAGA